MAGRQSDERKSGVGVAPGAPQRSLGGGLPPELARAHAGAGNAAVAATLARFSVGELVGDAVESIGTMFSEVAQAFGPLEIKESVGRGAKNRPEDVSAVRRKLTLLGYFHGGDGKDKEGEAQALEAAIERFQRDVVRAKNPDGRIDPGGRTLKVINAPAAAPAASPGSAPATTPTTEPAEPAPAGEQPETPPAAKEVPTPDGPAPAAGHADAGDGAALIAAHRANPALAAALANIEKIEAAGKELAKKAGEQDKKASKQESAAKKKKKSAADEAVLAEPHAERTWTQEVGAERDALVTQIGGARDVVAAVNAATLGLDEESARLIRAQLYRRLAHATPFYYQMVNANVLADSDTTAGGRTCNMTSLSMTLEGLGKTTANYKGDTGLLEAIAAQFAKAMGDASDRVSQDVRGLRLPDFLQLVAIAESMEGEERAGALALSQSDPAAFGKLIAKAGDKAEHNILVSEWFDSVARDFGCSTKNKDLFSSKDAPGGVSMDAALGRVGQLGRSLLPKAVKENAAKVKKGESSKTDDEVKQSVVDYFDKDLIEKLDKEEAALEAKLEELGVIEAELKKGGKELRGESKKVFDKLKKTRSELKNERAMSAAGVNKAGIDHDMLEKVIPVETYRLRIIQTAGKELDAGNQVIAHMYHHFTRLDSLHEDHVLLDDPGSWTGKDRNLTYDEARMFGTFDRITVVYPD